MRCVNENACFLRVRLCHADRSARRASLTRPLLALCSPCPASCHHLPQRSAHGASEARWPEQHALAGRSGEACRLSPPPRSLLRLRLCLRGRGVASRPELLAGVRLLLGLESRECEARLVRRRHLVHRRAACNMHRAAVGAGARCTTRRCMRRPPSIAPSAIALVLKRPALLPGYLSRLPSRGVVAEKD